MDGPPSLAATSAATSATGAVGGLAPFRAAVLAWYAAHGRDLAFRATTDPYAILVSEAMAQQTQAVRAAEFWTRFLAEFPTVRDLAAASPAAVLRAWRGLGYNRRALALRAAAIAIVRDFDGQVPDDISALEALPGVGPYTARAVAALAFGRPVGAVDVNVRRVMTRVVGGADGALMPAEVQSHADQLVPADGPGHWTHALMDVGATFCRPRAPRCDACPALVHCRYAAARTSATAVSPSNRAPRERPAPFETTNRWLRGRILDLLRDADGDGWATLPPLLGAHGSGAIATALEALHREGLAEPHPDDQSRARLPIA